jgi:osmoprotectant transport system ATP-binding protein
VGDLPLSEPLLVRAGDARAAARAQLAAAGGATFALLVDGGQRPLGWIDARDLAGDGPIDASAATPGAPTVQPESTLRDALSAMLGSSVQLGVVVDDRERVLGLISVDAISSALRAPQPRSPAAPARGATAAQV